MNQTAHIITTAAIVIELSGKGAIVIELSGKGAGDTEDAVRETQSKYDHLNILLCAGSAATGSPEWHHVRCCQGGNGG